MSPPATYFGGTVNKGQLQLDNNLKLGSLRDIQKKCSIIKIYCVSSQVKLLF